MFLQRAFRLHWHTAVLSNPPMEGILSFLHQQVGVGAAAAGGATKQRLSVRHLFIHHSYIETQKYIYEYIN